MWVRTEKGRWPLRSWDDVVGRDVAVPWWTAEQAAVVLSSYSFSPSKRPLVGAP